MLSRSVSKPRDQKKEWASETKMCSFARLLVSPHGTLPSAVCWLSDVPVFRHWQTSGLSCLIAGGRIVGSCSNAKDVASRQPFYRGRGVLSLHLHVLHSHNECIWKLRCMFFAARWPSCTLQRWFWIFTQFPSNLGALLFHLNVIWLSHLAFTTLFQLSFGW